MIRLSFCGKTAKTLGDLSIKEMGSEAVIVGRVYEAIENYGVGRARELARTKCDRGQKDAVGIFVRIRRRAANQN
jgi:hypothetical protein